MTKRTIKSPNVPDAAYLFEPPAPGLDADVEITSKDIRDALQRPSDFVYFGRDPNMFHTWGMRIAHLTRDSNLIEESNAAALERYLRSDPSLDEDWRIARASSSMVGWVDHLVFRVVERDLVTPTRIFRVLKQWFDGLESYPIADEADLSEREYTATIENIKEEGNSIAPDGPDDWAEQVYTWLRHNNETAVESLDGNGGSPSKEQILEALVALRYVAPEATVTCSVCGEQCSARLAHQHKGEWIGDECCWEERLPYEVD